MATLISLIGKFWRHRMQLASEFDEEIHETNKMFFWTALTRRPILLSRICRDLRGCCHAHSNWRAACSSQVILSKSCAHDRVKLTSFDGKPWTIICISHGRFSCVFLAPCASSPLCCLQTLVNFDVWR